MSWPVISPCWVSGRKPLSRGAGGENALAVCFLSFILIPLGMVLEMAFNLLIGLAMLQSTQEEVDYV